jgi:hypothetical protein
VKRNEKREKRKKELNEKLFCIYVLGSKAKGGRREGIDGDGQTDEIKW